MISAATWIRPALAAIAVVLVIAPATASAAQPKEGSYHWQGPCSDVPGAPCPTEQLGFSVADGKIKDLAYTSYSCGINEVGKSIKVKPNGKFKFSGNAENPGGQLTPMTIKGKFKSRTQAKGKFAFRFPSGCQPDATVKFVAKRQRGEGRSDRRAGTWTMRVSFPPSNTGTGTVTGDGINCPGDCSEVFPVGTGVTLTANPDPGSQFTTWSNVCEGDDGSCRVSGPENSELSASPNFVSTGGPGPGDQPPETTITKAPKKVKTSRSKAKVVFEFSSSASDSSFECRVDDKPFKPCQSPESLKAKLGKHTFEVRATDAAGLADESAAKAAFKVVKKK